MTSLVRLYPRSWRDRYEAEFLGLLEARPPSMGDRFDIVRGAVDARLHPVLPGSPAPDRESSRITRAAAATSFAAGLLWIAWLGVSIRGFDALNVGSVQDVGRFLSFAVLLALAASHVLLGIAVQGTMRAIGAPAVAVAVICFGLAPGAGGLALFGLLASLVFALAVAGRTIPVALAMLWATTTVLVFVGFYRLVASEWQDPSSMLVAIPYGVTWLAVGAVIGWRGVDAPAPTSVDVEAGSE